MSEPYWVPLGVAALPVPQGALVTSLPASPVDGQEVVLVDSLTAPTYQWRLRYDAAITDAYKWIYIGGTSGWAETATNETTTSATYGNLSGGATGPSFTLPRAGIYEIALGHNGAGSAAGVQALMSFDIGATGAVDADAVRCYANSAILGSWSRVVRKTVAVAGAITAKYRTTSGTGTFQDRFLSIRPIRLA